MRRIYTLLSFCTIVIFLLIYFGINSHWVLGILGLGFPLIVLVHLIVLMLVLIFKPKAVFPSLLVLSVSVLMLKRTYHLAESTGDTAKDINCFRILTYNVGNSERNNESADEYRKWLVNTNADIMILPEFSNYGSGKHNVAKFLRSNGFQFIHTVKDVKHAKQDRIIGLTVFSKYPIVYAKDTLFQELNGIIRADIKIMDDTVSIFGVHLYSMSLQLNKLVKQRNPDLLKQKGRETVSKIKGGFIHRKKEVDLLIKWVGETNHPVFIGGDFNETPYSYSYSSLIEHYRNAFEEKGSGFGFTFAGIPQFIRIDHQFYDSDKIEILNFNTDKNTFFSDHYPLIGTYRFREE